MYLSVYGMIMNKLFCIKTENGNNYLYNYSSDILLLVHPQFIDFIENAQGDKKTDRLTNIKERRTNYINKPYSSYKYYLSKVRFLKGCGIINFETNMCCIEKKLSEYDVLSGFLGSDVIMLEMTEKCNLNCHYCGYGDLYQQDKKRKNQNIRLNDVFALIKYFLDQRKLYNISKKVSICFYGGEPLLVFSLIEQIVNCVKQFQESLDLFEFEIITNGLLIDKYLEFLVKENFTIHISLDGNYLHNQYRVFKNGKSSFNKVFANAKLIEKKYLSYFKSKVFFKSVLHKNNNINDVYEFFYINFGKKVNISTLRKESVNTHKENIFTEIFTDIISSYHVSANNFIERNFKEELWDKKELSAILYGLNNYIFDNYNDLLFEKSIQKTPTNTCLPFSKRIFLTVDGDIFPCEKIGYKYPLARISNNKIHIDYKKIAELYNTLFTKVLDLCKSCFSQNSCSKCIFRLNFETDNLVCPGYSDSKLFRESLHFKLNKIERNSSVAYTF